MNSRRIKIGGAAVGAALAALLTANELWLPAYLVFDRLLSGERADDMHILGVVPYFAAVPIAIVVTTIAVRRRWPLYVPAVLAVGASAVTTFVNAFFMVRALTL